LVEEAAVGGDLAAGAGEGFWGGLAAGFVHFFI